MNNEQLQNILAMLKDVLAGWKNPTIQIKDFILTFIQSLGVYQGVFLVSCLLLMISATPHWLVYEVHFIDKKSITLGSDARMYFFLTGFLGIILNLVKFKYNREIYLFIIGLSTLAWLSGFIFPEIIHAHFRNMDDFAWNFLWIYIYGFFSLITAGTSYQAFTTNLIIPMEIKKFLLAKPDKFLK